MRIACFVAAAAFMFSSCASDPVEAIKGNDGVEMEFAVSDDTRASVTSAFDRFSIYGDRKLQSDKNATPKVIFPGAAVRKGSDGWSCQNIQYWFDRHEYSFVALHPEVVSGSAGLPVYSDSKLSFTYSLPLGADGLVADNEISDILFATHRRLYAPGGNPTVSLRFSHILSLINIAFTLDDSAVDDKEYIEVQKLEMSGFRLKASFSITPASLQSAARTDDSTVAVDPQEGSGKLTVNFANPVKIMNQSGSCSIFEEKNALIMLPQTFSADSGASIDITYKISYETVSKKISIPLKERAWESGKSYTYRITVERAGARPATTTISDWTMQDSGNLDAY